MKVKTERLEDYGKLHSGVWPQVLRKVRNFSGNVSGTVSVTLFLAVFLIFALSGCYFFPKEEEVLAPPLRVPQQVTYDTLEVKKGDLVKRIICTGYFRSVSQADLFFKYRGGRLKDIKVKTGDSVKAGELLAELDTDTLENQIKQQKSVLTRAKLNYERIKTGGAIDIQAARLSLEILKKEYNRLNASAGTKQKDSPDSLSSNSLSPDSLEKLKDQIRLQQMNIKKLEADYGTDKKGEDGFLTKQALLEVEEAQAQLDSLQDELNKSKLYSSISGQVTYVSEINAGEYVSAYQNIIRIADPRRLQLEYTGNNLSDFRLGMKVDVEIESTHFPGIVAATPADIPESADGETQRIWIKVEGLTEAIEIGTTGVITLVLDQRKNVIALPRNLVNYFSGRRYVLVLNKGLRQERDVETGLENDTDVEIIKGLKEGEMVITN